MKLVLISDTHGKWNKITVPECDVLISAGDYSFRGEQHMVKDFHKWMSKQPARYFISVQGNHELWVEQNFSLAQKMVETIDPRIYFIDEGSITIEGVNIHCSAITPEFCNWAWNRKRGAQIKRHWDAIPDDTNVLVTHGPPAGILDVVYNRAMVPIERVGCHDLMNRINELKQLKLHVFGHIHGSSGEMSFNGVKYINSSICDEMYLPTNPVREFEL